MSGNNETEGVNFCGDYNHILLRYNPKFMEAEC